MARTRCVPRARLAVLFFALLLAPGCVTSPAPTPSPSAAASGSPAPVGRVVDGLVLDVEQRPVANATIEHLGGNATTSTNDTGRFHLENLPAAREVLLQARKDGYEAQTLSINLEFAQSADARFLLAPVAPNATHYTNISDGEIACEVVAGSMEDHEGHQGLSCQEVVPEPADTVRVPAPAGLSVIVVEVTWEPQSQAAEVLELVVSTSTNKSETLLGSVMNTAGDHYLQFRASLPSVREVSDLGGHVVSQVKIAPGALDDELPMNAGAAIQQGFTVYTSVFYGENPSPVWTALSDAG